MAVYGLTKGLNLPYPMESHFFKFIFLQFRLQIQIPRKKVSKQSVFLFFFWWGQGKKCKKLKKTEKLEGKFKKVGKNTVFVIFDLFPDRILKKERHFVLILFHEESESAIGIVKKLIWKNEPP